jgi:hypothetical protein
MPFVSSVDGLDFSQLKQGRFLKLNAFPLSQIHGAAGPIAAVPGSRQANSYKTRSQLPTSFPVLQI